MGYGVITDLANNPLFETEILCAFTARFAPNDYPQLRKELLAKESWQERLNRIVSLIFETGTFTERANIEFAAQSLYNKFRAADK